MEETHLKNLLRNGRKSSSRWPWRCPDESKLAAYADSRLDGAARESVEAHLSDCKSCLTQVSFIVESADWPKPDAPPTQLIAKARSLVSEKPRTTTFWGWRWTAGATAAAACLILVIALIVALRTRQPESFGSSETPLVAKKQAENIVAVPNVSPDTDLRNSASPSDSAKRPRPASSRPKPVQSPAPVLRSAEVNGLLPKLLFPRDGAVLARSELEFRWQPVNDALFYEVLVMTATGDIVLEQKTEDTRLLLSSHMSLASGAKYFILVRAHLREGKTAKSRAVSFRILN